MKKLSIEKPKIKILSPSKDWEKVINEVKEKAYLLIGGKEIENDLYFLLFYPKEEYLPKKYGIERRFLSALMCGKQADITLLHVPEFEVEGALAWYHYVNGKPFIQLYRNHLREYSRTGEFKYRTAETIVHELCHHYYRKIGIEDRTHYFHFEKNSILEAVKDIKKNLLQTQVSLLEEIVRLLSRTFSSKHKTEVDKEYYCLHHSGTSRDNTKAETIINNSKQKYNGKCFYDIVIDKDGNIYTPESFIKERGTRDICVIGSFDKEQPTEAQIRAVNGIIHGKEYTSHRELAKKGLATPSICPGDLMIYLD